MQERTVPDCVLLPIGGIGDHISMIPAIMKYAETHSIAVDAHPIVQSLMPPQWDYVSWPGDPEVPKIAMSIERVITEFGVFSDPAHYARVEKPVPPRTPRGANPARLAFSLLGMDIPTDEPAPQIRWDRTAPVVDVVFAPFSSSQFRALDGFQAVRLLNEIRREISDDVLVIGGAANRNRVDFCGAAEAYDYPLTWVAGAIANAQIVVTVDSMANRIAHAVQAKRHILLSDEEVGAEWAGWKPTATAPGAFQLHGRENWRPRNVIDAIRRSAPSRRVESVPVGPTSWIL